jgi:hypothetical protein
MLIRGFTVKAAPDLSARTPVVIEEADAQAGLGSCDGSSHATRAGADDDDIERRIHSVTTFMPGAQSIWQVRR